ncbi:MULTISPECIES: FMN-binding protein MioC [Pantoea]|jgi:MioC protein|uniref:FMN-binding protein MioC n=1 Tax=Pantoea TaxID=53335 RepID=UPI00073F8358|nr:MULTISPECIES: FMN-binding protein MioC [Pantoea]KAF6658413.1 FMN-binding protein MioC [Enterobacteriaceae bacterium EKM102V]KAA5969962.1 FMN-binding protein MioC [Pantoea sp. M_6]KAA5973751.1 FMN-binding protein MioC [Pantoea sp. M_8]KAA5988414.1 FMN-binding protein MioC [Pantoea sp. M_10]KAA5989634.1 FMN-binding protein MioC [Pantoea sp. M_5]
MADITLISGSTLGSAEYVAEHLEEKLQEAGFSTQLLHGPELDEVPQTGIWLVVCSTHGAGDIPDNLLPLAEAIRDSQPDLSQVRFGAVGLGNHEYDLFCGAIRQIDALLTAQGAQRIGDRLEIDVLEHEIPEDPAEAWLETWKNAI